MGELSRHDDSCDIDSHSMMIIVSRFYKHDEPHE